MPKLHSDKLASQLNTKLRGIYLVSGDEALVVQECCDLVRQAAKAHQFQDRELYHADANFDWSLLHYAAQSMSLFAEKKFLEIRVTGKLSEQGRKALVEYANTPPADTLLLLVMGKFERSTLNAKWFQSLEKACEFIQVWPVTVGQLPRWISQRAKRLNLTIAPDALDILVSRVEGNLLAAAQEIEKLALLTDDGRIDAPLMAHAVADSARYDVFTLVDKALHGDPRGAVKTLQGLRSEGTEILTILWALTRETRTLIQIKTALHEGKALEGVAKRFGIWDNRQPLIKAAVARLSMAQLQSLLQKAAQIDRSVKGMSPADPWAICLEMVLNIAGIQSLSEKSEQILLSSAREK